MLGMSTDCHTFLLCPRLDNYRVNRFTSKMHRAVYLVLAPYVSPGSIHDIYQL